MMERLVERERKYGLPAVDLRFADTETPCKGLGSFNVRNYNVNTKLVTEPVVLYRPNTMYI
jgi:hypothetical protein